MKTNLLIIIFSLVCTLAFPAVAKTVQSTAGNFATLLTPEEQLTITDLTVGGTLDARDIKFLRDNLASLTTLNLSEASILAYTGKLGTDTLASSYPANELPSKSFDRNVNTSKAALQSIVLPNALVSIGFGAFIGCKTLNSVVFPSTLTKIGNYAFFDCDGLSSVTMPGSVKSIGDYAFNGCDGLTGVSIPQSVTRLGDWSFANCTALPAITVPSSIATIGSHTFYGCKLLTNVTIPVGVTSIGEAAFARCTSLQSISLPSSVASLGESIFSGCTTLTDVLLPASTDSIPNRAFSDCDALTGFTFPASVTYLGASAFYHCSSLSSVTYSSSLASIGESALEHCVRLTDVTLPGSVTAINRAAFSSCSGLTSLTIPSTVKRVDDWAFFGCTGLTRLVLPASLDSVGGYAFANCTGIADVSIQAPIKTLGEGVFSSCNALTTITIPSSVTVIDKKAFTNCIKLSSVVLPSSLKRIDEEAFSYCSALTGITLPDGLSIIGKSAFSYCTSLTGVTVPSSVKTLPESVFGNCTKLTSVTLPNTITSIGYRAFAYCTGLVSIHIPESVTLIDGSAFSYCSKLSEMVLPVSVNTIGPWAYLGCTSMARFTIPATVKSIGSGAFYNCSGLTSITNNIVTPLSIATNVFYSVNKTTCTLNVSTNTAESYRKAAVWMDFTNIVEVQAPKTDTIPTPVIVDKTQVISLAAGWNIISGNVKPADNNISSVFGGLATLGTLRKVLDESGLTYERISQQKGWVNSIGNFGQTEGYKVQMKVAGNLTITGPVVTLPLDIPLKAGLNIISCPFETERDAMAVFQPLIQSGSLKKVMDESGNSIENFASYGGWKNTIGNLKPGKGYIVDMVKAATLTMTNSLLRSSVITSETETAETTHFIKAYTGNGINHMNINLVDLGASNFKAGDEIGIFDGNVCVGSTVLTAEDVAIKSVSVIASCDDSLGAAPDGFTPGNKLSIMAYSNLQTYKLSIETLWGSETFEENGSLFAKVTSIEPVLTNIREEKANDKIACFPNPFVEAISINIEQEAGSRLVVEIFNLVGQRVVRLFDGISTGNNHFTWNGVDERGRQVPTGSYLCRFNGSSRVILRSGN